MAVGVLRVIVGTPFVVDKFHIVVQTSYLFSHTPPQIQSVANLKYVLTSPECPPNYRTMVQFQEGRNEK